MKMWPPKFTVPAFAVPCMHRSHQALSVCESSPPKPRFGGVEQAPASSEEGRAKAAGSRRSSCYRLRQPDAWRL